MEKGEPLHVLMLVSNPVVYDPRVRKEAESLAHMGHRVTIIGWDRESRYVQEESENSVRILRIRSTPSMKLLAMDLLRLKPWWRLAFLRALELDRVDSFDAVHCHDLDTLPTGVRLKRNLGIPLVYDAHEIWGYMVSKDLPPPLPRYYLWMEKRLIRYVDRVVTVNDPLRQYFERISDASVYVVMNAKDVVSPTYLRPANEVFTAIYVGSLNDSRFVMGMVDAVEGLGNSKLVIGGVGKPRYVESLRSKCKKVPNVDFIGEVPQEKVLALTLGSDVVLSMFDARDKLARIGLPNKVFEAMACGRPIIVSEGTYLADFTAKHRIGIVVEHSVKGVRSGIERLRDDPNLCETLGKRSLEKALGEFNWKRQEEVLAEVYEGLT